MPCCRKIKRRRRNRNEHVDNDPPHIDEEIAEVTCRLRNARMIAARAQKPTAADRNKLEMQKKIWLKFEKADISGVVLKIGVRHERHYRVEDRGRREHPRARVDSAASSGCSESTM